MQACQEPGCGHLNRPGARFCEKCGKALLDSRASALRPGHLLREAAYRILEPLGKGGMGALYLAADTGAFDRLCVVKELLDYYDPTDPAETRQAQARFEREARLLAELNHPGIPRIYSYFSEGGRHYIVMEYIEGETLERAVSHIDSLGRTVAADPLSAEDVVRHGIRVCRVLEYLADRPTPVVHHDIKPANLIVDRTSTEVRLVDFGTAQIHARWAAPRRIGPDSTSLFGTKGYAAPEQYQGRSDPRSDVYALAATIYHLLTDDDPGDHPFQFPQMSGLPGVLANALTRALHPEVSRRSTAPELRQAMETWLVPEEVGLPFVFRNGAVAHTTADLVALCDQHWAEARQYLTAGDFDRWFRARNRHDLVAKAKTSQLEPNPDAALEMFLRRLDPRLPLPRLTLDPLRLDFGRVARNRGVSRRLTVRNQGRGYGRAGFGTSVPWLEFDPLEVGCLPGADGAVEIHLDVTTLPLRRIHQATITCTLTPGARVMVPVDAELDLLRELFQRLVAASQVLGRIAGQGARQGIASWTRAFWSLLRVRHGVWILMGEVLILAAVMVALWWNLSNPATALGFLPRQPISQLAVDFLRMLPLALLAVYLLPAVTLVGGAIAWELLKALAAKLRGP